MNKTWKERCMYCGKMVDIPYPPQEYIAYAHDECLDKHFESIKKTAIVKRKEYAICRL